MNFLPGPTGELSTCLASFLDPPKVLLLRAFWCLLDCIWGLLKGSWGGAGYLVLMKKLRSFIPWWFPEQSFGTHPICWRFPFLLPVTRRDALLTNTAPYTVTSRYEYSTERVRLRPSYSANPGASCKPWGSKQLKVGSIHTFWSPKSA